MDLTVIVVVTLLIQPLIYGLPVEPVRIALGVLLVLFSPGYVLVSVLYPIRGRLAGAERIALSIGLSLALVPLLGLALNFAPGGIHLTSILLTLTLWTVVLAAIAWRRRLSVMAEDRFDLPLSLVINWCGKGRRPMDLAFGAVTIFVVLVVVGAFAWKIQQPTPGVLHTDFYVLGSGGMIQDYPTALRVGEPQDYNVGLVNHEAKTLTFSIEALLNGERVGEVGPLTLINGETWDSQIEVKPIQEGALQKLELRLFREKRQEVYRSVYLFVDVFPSK